MANSRDFAAPGQKYSGQLQIGGGPVPLQRWTKPYTRDQHDRKYGAEGTDLHPERKPAVKGNSKLPKPKPQSGG